MTALNQQKVNRAFYLGFAFKLFNYFLLLKENPLMDFLDDFFKTSIKNYEENMVVYIQTWMLFLTILLLVLSWWVSTNFFNVILFIILIFIFVFELFFVLFLSLPITPL